jgi:hypothetical protein
MNKNLKNEINILRENFNSLSLTLISFLSKISNNPLFKIYNKMLVKIIKNNPNKLIDVFIINVLKYKEQIISEDEKFFMEYSTNDKEDNLKIFEFKNIWKSLDELNKKRIKSYMKILCEISSKYLDNIYIVSNEIKN